MNTAVDQGVEDYLNPDGGLDLESINTDNNTKEARYQTLQPLRLQVDDSTQLTTPSSEELQTPACDLEMTPVSPATLSLSSQHSAYTERDSPIPLSVINIDVNEDSRDDLIFTTNY